jgi:hypothetical protein
MTPPHAQSPPIASGGGVRPSHLDAARLFQGSHLTRPNQGTRGGALPASVRAQGRHLARDTPAASVPHPPSPPRSLLPSTSFTFISPLCFCQPATLRPPPIVVFPPPAFISLPPFAPRTKPGALPILHFNPPYVVSSRVLRLPLRCGLDATSPRAPVSTRPASAQTSPASWPTEHGGRCARSTPASKEGKRTSRPWRWRSASESRSCRRCVGRGGIPGGGGQGIGGRSIRSRHRAGPCWIHGG